MRRLPEVVQAKGLQTSALLQLHFDWVGFRVRQAKTTSESIMLFPTVSEEGRTTALVQDTPRRPARRSEEMLDRARSIRQKNENVVAPRFLSDSSCCLGQFQLEAVLGKHMAFCISTCKALTMTCFFRAWKRALLASGSPQTVEWCPQTDKQLSTKFGKWLVFKLTVRAIPPKRKDIAQVRAE